MSPAFVLQFMVHVACPSSGVSTPLNSGVPKQAGFLKTSLVKAQTTAANTEVLRAVHMQCEQPHEGSGILRCDAVSMEGAGGGGFLTFRRILMPSFA